MWKPFPAYRQDKNRLWARFFPWAPVYHAIPATYGTTLFTAGVHVRILKPEQVRHSCRHIIKIQHDESLHCLISSKGTLPRRKWRTRIVCSWWPKGVGTEFVTLLPLRAATFGQHQDPPSGVSFLTPVGSDMTSGLIC